MGLQSEESKDEFLLPSKVNHLKCQPLLMVHNCDQQIDFYVNGTTFVWCAIHILYQDWGIQLIEGYFLLLYPGLVYEVA
jgi:hypothetical protein